MGSVLQSLSLAVCLGASLLNATEPLTLEPGPAPKFLEPVTRYRSWPEDPYQVLLKKSLVVTPGTYGHMLVVPSFRPEYAISVYGDDFKEGDVRQPQRFQITLTRAKTSLYDSLPRNNEAKKQLPVEIQRVDVRISREFAVAIQQAWAAMLLKTRYPGFVYRGLDGRNIYFSVFVGGLGEVEGMIWSPESGLTSEMATLGEYLVGYCELSPDKRPDAKVLLMAQLEKFTANVQKQ